jgi:hypothetical protein
MKHFQILERSWKTLWSYRTLWIFGILMALTTASPFPGRNGNNVNYQTNSQELNNFASNISPQLVNVLIAVGIGLACFMLILILVFLFAHYISNTALIRMVEGDERTGEKVTWRQGFRLGWSRASWRIFLIDLIVFVPVVLAFIVLFGCAGLPVILPLISGNTPPIPAIVGTIGLASLIILLALVVGLLLAMLMNFIYRICALNDTGVIESIRQGWQMLRANLKDIFLMWLLTIGIEAAYYIAAFLVFILLAGFGIIFGGGIALVLHTISAMSMSDPAAWIAGGILGGLVFLLIVGIPLLFLGGLKATYLSTVWTLAYMDLKALALPALEPPAGPLAETPA